MESRAERTDCTQRQMRTDRFSEVQSLRESSESNIRDSSSQFCSTSGRIAGDNLGMTRASMDQGKREIRQTTAAKMQEIRNLQGIIEELHAGIDHSFVKLENKLKHHPENPAAVVQRHIKYFNEVSQQISELHRRIAVLSSEMDRMQQMVTPVQKNQERKIRSEVNMEKISKPRSQRNTFTTEVKSNLSVHANLEGDGHGRYTYTGSQVPASSSQSNAARASVNPAVINPVSGIPLSSNRYSVLEYTDNTVDEDESDADIICNEYCNENFPSEAEQKIDAEQSPTRTKGKTDLSNTHTPILQESSTAVQKEISRPSVKEIVRRFEAADDGQKSEESTEKGVRRENAINPCQEERIFTPSHTVKVWRPREPPLFCGRSTEDVHRWVSIMRNYLTFVECSEKQKVAFISTFLREAAHEWLLLHEKENGTPKSWKDLTQALIKRFGSNIRAQEAQMALMKISQGKRKMRDYSNEFQSLLCRLPSYDEKWMINLFIWGLQPHIAKSVSLQYPNTVTEAIKYAETADAALRASQKPYVTGNSTAGKLMSQEKKKRSGIDEDKMREDESCKIFNKGKKAFSFSVQRVKGQWRKTVKNAGETKRRMNDDNAEKSPVKYIHAPSHAASEREDGLSRHHTVNGPAAVWRNAVNSVSKKVRAGYLRRKGPIIEVNLAALARSKGAVVRTVSQGKQNRKR